MKLKRIISVLIAVMIVVSVCAMGTITSGASGTGTGLAEWALNAYYSGWRYVYGGSTPGAVDCSGLIYSYAGGYRGGDAQTFNSDFRGYVSDGVPNIHGLGLYHPGHVGVYVGGGMAVDARGDQWGVCYEGVYDFYWTQYFKVPGVSYPDTGWEQFNGNSYYYENGEYLANTTRTIDGVTYYFDATGASSADPSGVSYDAEEEDGEETAPSYTDETEQATEAQNDNGPLMLGSSGDRVRKLQERLQELGYYDGAIDGDFGMMTEQAFRLFQITAGLYADGIAGSDADILFSDDAPYYTDEEFSFDRHEEDDMADTGVTAEEAEDAEEPEETDETDESAEEATEETPEDATEEEEEIPTTFKKGDYSEYLVPVQERLISLGYLQGEADGSFGSQTEEAVITFQSVNNIPQSGEIDEITYQMIFSNVAAYKPAEPETEAPTEAETAAPVQKAAVATTAPQTEVELQTAELSNKALAGLTDSIGFKQGENATNFEFLLWLAIMIVVMLLTFSVVYAIEKKKQRAKARPGRRYQ